LLAPGIPEEEVFIKAAALTGATLGCDDVTRNLRQAYELYEELYAGDDSFWADEERSTAIWLTVYAHLARLSGVPDQAEAIARIVHETYFHAGAWKLFDDVLPTLDALKARGVRMGLISNWDSSLEPIIMDLGLGHYFATIIASTVVRMHKPQRQIFDLALERIGCAASEAIHVGDHLQADVGGARQAGLTPVLIDRDHLHRPTIVAGGAGAAERAAVDGVTATGQITADEAGAIGQGDCGVTAAERVAADEAPPVRQVTADEAGVSAFLAARAGAANQVTCDDQLIVIHDLRDVLDIL
jgi:putative hydrolase of the HAD superfamily